MIVDAANAAAIYDNNRTERALNVNPAAETNINNEGLPEAGSTSEIGPPVVTNISAAALETSRALAAPEQTAQENRTNDIVEAEERGQNQPAAEQAGQEAPPRERPPLDVVA